MQETMKKKILNMLSQQKSISLTVDIWSDRTMRNYLGITAHFAGKEVAQPAGKKKLSSLLLKFRRFLGSHTGESIRLAFEQALEEFEIKDKVSYVVTDNAANMRAAFKTRFPCVETEADDDQLGEVDDDIFQGLSEADELDIQAAVENTTRQRISCFAHSLQLVVADGLKEAKNLSAPLSKASRLSTLLHRSTIFKER